MTEPAMPDPIDRLLVRPSDGELAAACREAAGASGRLGRLRQLHDGFWPSLFSAIAQTPEGRRQWEQERPQRYGGAAYVVLAWWTDPHGGRHYRVCGGDTTGGGPHRHHCRSPEDARPPLWHVYPDRLFHRRQAGRGAWLAACACGVVGPPAALAWTGPCCGPCHDRREEALLPPPEPAPGLLDFGGRPVQAVVFAPGSAALAVAACDRHIYHHDLSSGERRALWVGGGDDKDFSCLAFSPDGQTLAVGDPEDMMVHLLACDDREGEGYERSEELDWLLGDEIKSVTFAPNGRSLVACGEAVKVWRKGRAEGWAGEWDLTLEDGRAAAYAPDGRTLAVGGADGRVRLFDTRRWGERHSGFRAPTQPEEQVLFLDYLSEDRLLVLTGFPIGMALYRPLRVGIWDLTSCKEVGHGSIPHAGLAALAPGGRFLAWVAQDFQHSPAALTFWDVAARREHFTLEWDPEDLVRDLAFAPDGQTLATAHASGTVKLWPWRALIEA
jgi:hypothetical protein